MPKKKSTNSKPASATPKTTTLQSTIKENLASFVLGIIVVLLLILAGVRYIVTTNKDIVPANIANLFGAGDEEVTEDKVRKYVVKEGDDLCTIAQEFYNDCTRGFEIAETNKLEDPNVIEVGQELILPEDEAKDLVEKTIESTPEGATSSARTTQATGENVYVVQQGDYLWQIAAEQYGDPYMWPTIAEANNLVDPDFLSVGSKLQLPR